MGGSGFVQFDETIVQKKARSGSLPPQPVSTFFPTKARSKSLYDHRAFPQVMDRASTSTFKHRALPEIPGDSQCSPGNYINVHVDGRVDSVQQRPLPTPPNAAGGTYISEGEYLNPVDQDIGRRTVRNKSIADGPDSYVDMQSPQRRLERIESGVALSPPLSPNESYENITPPSFLSSYENMEPNAFNNNSPNLGHLVEDPAPKLPPRRSKSVRDDRAYVNLPGGGDRPPRPPLRKAHTLGR
ncbi:Hypothetical predicted protein [Paramuricea clavata]|uniref:Uncharacterized protein n=1 Tax=Paramuricea clavata TaxID=317549 RepID=A0A6S7HK90_PARCT|nr:Hypothetical predicted protein [Paramuricea clavata]